MLLQNYLSVFIFFSLSFSLSLLIFVLSYALSAKAGDAEKLSSYECGFSPFADSRNEFDIKFYIVAILFLIFDIEISFLFPFAISFDGAGSVGVISVFSFLLILAVGFFYE
jgi:NADH-quinone oxidoreductase subunit A